MIILEIKFSFSDWENKKVQTFRDNIEDFIGLTFARTTLLLSSDLDESGISFFLLTTDSDFAGQVQYRFGMKAASNTIDIKALGVEYGNSELIK